MTTIFNANAGGLPRRKFLVGLPALGAGTLLPGCQTAGGGAADATPFCIDIHHHYVPDAYSAAFKQFKIRPVKWSVQASLEEMDKSGIATAMISPPPPGITFGDQAFGRKLARDINEAGAKMVSDRPRRFRLRASLPFADVEGALAEIAYAYDTLKADGISLMTSYGGKYLGDPSAWPILEELNRRKAVVYTHPTTPACCARVLPITSINTIEGPVDTTRTMASLLFTGAAARYPDIRWIFSHSGGVMPFLLSRFHAMRPRRRAASRSYPMGSCTSCAGSTTTPRRATIPAHLRP